MTGEQFAYWLNGYLEISGVKELGEAELKILKDHLALVFNKVTPSYTYGITSPGGSGGAGGGYVGPYYPGTTITC